ncbi:ABC transporter permease [Listeria booriae]|uniref:ABC transporter permease n=1 Tax=Listeria booriae TaxID=1552123 RepID=UPI0016233437|nr:ABC transporter permease [Listeria booriae]MBC2147433.1 ABC transporter permease [Listeria booriae]MBC2180078.1 ABC transporter permease [Listeria booriae]MBC2187907.1 ABC transporter permease [Listeria booriae]
MIQTIFKRLLQTIPMLFIISLVSFALVQLAPGDPITSFVTPNMNPDDVERIRQSLGLDQPIYVQYFKWLANVLQGNFGYSLINNQPVLGQIIERLPATIGLMGTALFFTLLLSIPLGLVAAAYENTRLDRVLNAVSYIGISIPIFWFAMILIDVFSVQLGWLPSLGMRTIGVESFWDVVKHAILPVMALTFQGCASYYRYVRSNTINQLKEEYVLFGYAKGLSKAQIMRHHVLKNSLLPVITLLGMYLPQIITGAFITESVFSWPGMGSLGINAIFQLDYPMIMAITMFSALLLIIGNLLADIAYTIIDPRIREVS